MYLLAANSNKPLYQQLYQQMRTKILNGELSARTKLPSSRRLAAELYISRNTVDTAYQQLLSEGYIVGKSRSGYYVETLHNTKLSAFTEAVPDTAAGQVLPDEILYDFRYGNLSPQLFPFAQWQRLTNLCLQQDQGQFSNYNDFRGEPGLRQELVKYLHEYRDVRCTADQIWIAAGTMQCLLAVCQLLRPVARAIAMEDPGFANAYLAFTNYGFAVPLIPVNSHGLNVKALRAAAAQAVYVTPSHQFPTGRIMTITRRLQLIDWAYEQDSLIIEDDYNCHLRYDVKPAPALQGLAPDKVIYIGSFSKILSPSLRVAYMVLPKKLTLQLQQKTENYACSVPLLIQKPLERFLQENFFESHLRKLLRQFKKKRDILLRSLQEHFGDSITVTGANAGIHILVQLKLPVSSQELVARAAQAGVAINGDNLWVEAAPGNGARVLLGFGTIANEDIDPAVRLLRQAWVQQGI